MSEFAGFDDPTPGKKLASPSLYRDGPRGKKKAPKKRRKAKSKPKGRQPDGQMEAMLAAIGRAVKK